MSFLSSYFQDDPICSFLRVNSCPVNSKSAGIPSAATSSLLWLPSPCPTLLHSGLCLEMPQMLVPKFPNSRQHRMVLSLSGSLEASSQRGLREGTRSPSPRWGQPLSTVTTLLKQTLPTSTWTSKNTKPSHQCPGGGWWVRLAEPVLRHPFCKSCRGSLAPRFRKPRNSTPTALFFGASVETETEISCYSCLWSPH